MNNKNNVLPLSPVRMRVEGAERLASKGIKIFPLHGIVEGHCTCKDTECESKGKHPIGKWKLNSTSNLSTVRSLWDKVPHANIGIPTGSINGFFVLDVDGEKGYDQLQEWIAEFGELPATWQVTTGNGMHLYYRCPEFRIPNTRGSLGVGIDTRGDGGYVVGPYSTSYREGIIYTFVNGRSPNDIALAEAPQFLLDNLKEINQFKIDESLELDIGEYRTANDSVMRELSQLCKKSKWLRELLGGTKKFDSHSEFDLSLANCLVKLAFEDKDIASTLYQFRLVKKEKKKYPGYYAGTVAKARGWGGNVGENGTSSVEENGTGSEEEAMPLPEEPGVKAFPPHIFPPPLREMINRSAKALQVPIDLVAVHMLTCCGAAIGATRRIELKESWQEQGNLFSMVVADAGTGKSPALAKVFKPFLEVQLAMRERYDEDCAQYQRDKRHYDMNKEDLDPPAPPLLGEVYVTSTTVEALNKVLSVNDRGVLLKGDELSGWTNSMGQYKPGGKGDDLEAWLSIWSGTDIKVNRAGQDPVMIPNPFCAVTGNITPDTISQFQDKQENGFIHRILISYPDKSEAMEWTDEGVPRYVVDDYHDVVKRLFGLKFKIVNDRQVHEILYLSAEAKKEFVAFYNKTMKEMVAEDFSPKLKGVWAKIPGQVARIALILQMVWGVCGSGSLDEIEGVVMKKAISTAEYFMSHARKVYFHLGESLRDKHIIEAVHCIKRMGGEVSRRDAQRKRLVGCKKASEVDALFEELADCGYGRVIKVPTNGRPTAIFKLF